MKVQTSKSEKLNKLRLKFLKNLPERSRKIANVLIECCDSDRQSIDQTGADKSLHMMLHGLAGAAGTFGYNSLSEKSRKCELMLEAAQKNDFDSKHVEKLKSEVSSLQLLIEMTLTTRANSFEEEGKSLKLAVRPLIYYLEDDVDQAEFFLASLGDSEYEFQHFKNVDSLKTAYKKQEPAAMLLDMEVDNQTTSGANFLQSLSKKESLPPCAFLSIHDDIESRLAAFRAGASRYIVKPTDKKTIIRTLDQITYRVPTDSYKALLVDDETLLLERNSEILKQVGIGVETLDDPTQVFNKLEGFHPDIIILDVYMPGISGPEVAAMIRSDEKYHHIPILFLSAEKDLGKQLMALNLGGDDFITKPPKPAYFQMSVISKIQKAREARATAERLKSSLYERERERHAFNQHTTFSLSDKNGKIVQVNENLCRLSGYEKSELVGKSFDSIASCDDSKEVDKVLWETISNGEVWNGERCRYRKDGTIYWVEQTVTPFLDSDGKPYQFISVGTDVTEIKAMQFEAALAHENLESTLESTADGILAVNDEGQVNFANKQFYNMWHIPKHMQTKKLLDDALLDEVQSQLIHPEAFLELVKKLYHSNKVHFDIVEFKDGRVFERYTKPVITDKGRTGRVWSFRDVTQATNSENELKAKEEKYRTLTKNIPGMVYRGDKHWNPEYISNCIDVSGYTSHELEHIKWLSLIHEEDQQQVLEDSQKLRIESTVIKQTYRIYHKNGNIVWINDIKQSVFDENGEFLGIDGIVFDITEQVKLTERSLELKERLRRGQVFANVGTWEWNIVSGELYWSERIGPLFGYSDKEVETSYDNFINAVHPDDRQKVMDAVNDCIENDVPYDVEHRVVWEDGTVRWLLEKGDVARNKDGDAIQMLGVVQDITHEVELRESLVASRVEADKANQAKSQFLSSMSHELRTPLNAIIGFSDLLDMVIKDANQKEFIQNIKVSSAHLLDLINDILDLAKIDSGSLALNIEDIDLCDLLKLCVDLTKQSAIQKSIDLSLIGCDEELDRGYYIKSDLTRTKQVILNFISNAIKYNHEGGKVEINVESIAHGNDNNLRINIVDSGMGIPEKYRNKVFEPFNRLGREAQAIEGTGIGLSICKTIAEAMNGKVGFDSVEGEGSTFWLELPKLTKKVKKQVESNQSLEQSRDSSKKGIKKVLYIEDNEINIKLMIEIVKKVTNVEMSISMSAEEGIEEAKQLSPDLILLDIHLPGMDGDEALPILKKLDNLKDTKIIALSANAMKEDIEQALKLGFDGYVTKPLVLNEILDVLRS